MLVFIRFSTTNQIELHRVCQCCYFSSDRRTSQSFLLICWGINCVFLLLFSLLNSLKSPFLLWPCLSNFLSHYLICSLSMGSPSVPSSFNPNNFQHNFLIQSVVLFAGKTNPKFRVFWGRAGARRDGITCGSELRDSFKNGSSSSETDRFYEPPANWK